MMTPKLPINIDNLLHQRTIESERVEYKAGWNPESVIHTLSAFANDFHNLGGGYVVIGVAEENGRPISSKEQPPVGLLPEQIDAIQKELLNLGNSAIQPPYHPLTATYNIQGKTILVLWAFGGETRPYKAKVSLSNKKSDWAYYVRKHTSTVKAIGETERELISLAATVPFDDRYKQTATLDDLAPHLIREFLTEIGSDLAKDAATMTVEQLAQRLNIVGGPPEALFPKNVGLLFFNPQPEKFFPVTQIDVVYFPEGAGGDNFEEKEFRGPLGRITRDAVDYIGRNYLTEMVVKHPDRPEAERFWNFPLAAIEEAVVNAVYHRSYEIREPVEVRIYKEELMVLSFPGPDRSIRLEDLQQGKAVSRRYRNRRIGEFLKELDLTEGRSTGLPKIFSKMARNGSPKPIFETDEDRSYFLVRLPVHKKFAELETEQITSILTPQTGTKQGLSKEQVVALETSRVEVPITLLMQAVGRTNRTKFRDAVLTPLFELGLIEMTQPESPRSPTQKYRLTELGKQVLATKEQY